MTDTANQRICPNCQESYAQESNFCPNCGQSKESSIITFKELVTDFLGSLVSFDSKVFTTIPKLLFKPGKLTKEYIEGKRTSQLSPFRLYLFLSIVLILLLSFAMKNDDKIFKINSEETSAIIDSLNTAIHSDSVLIDSLNLEGEEKPKNSSIANVNLDRNDIETLDLLNKSNKMIEQGFTIDEVADSLLSDYKFWRRFTVKQTLKLQHNDGEGMFTVFLKTSSYGMFIFLPLFALILKILYRRRKRFYIEHVIFTLHFYSFIFFILMLFVLINLVQIEIPRWIMLVIIIGYLYLSMLKVYNQSYGKTLLKCISLILTTTIFIGPLMLILVSLVSFIFY